PGIADTSTNCPPVFEDVAQALSNLEVTLAQIESESPVVIVQLNGSSAILANPVLSRTPTQNTWLVSIVLSNPQNISSKTPWLIPENATLCAPSFSALRMIFATRYCPVAIE